MDPFEYVVVVTSLITGLGMTQILTGMADIIANIKNVKMSKTLNLVILSTFLNLMQEWFYNYQYATHVKQWTLLTIMGVTLYPILLFFLARMIFPTGGKSGVTDLDKYYYEQWPWFFRISAAVILVSVFHDIFISGFTVADQSLKFVMIAVHLIFLIWKVENRTAHFVFWLLTLLGMVVFILATDQELVDYTLITDEYVE